MNYQKLTSVIAIVTICTLSTIIVGIVLALLFGLFDKSHTNYERIFAILNPAFQTIVGAFVGLISGINLGVKMMENKKE